MATTMAVAHTSGPMKACMVHRLATSSTPMMSTPRVVRVRSCDGPTFIARPWDLLGDLIPDGALSIMGPRSHSRGRRPVRYCCRIAANYLCEVSPHERRNRQRGRSCADREGERHADRTRTHEHAGGGRRGSSAPGASGACWCSPRTSRAGSAVAPGTIFRFSDSDASIERMAIVGERKWEDLALLFTAKGLRAFPIEFLRRRRCPTAQDWLAARLTNRSTGRWTLAKKSRLVNQNWWFTTLLVNQHRHCPPLTRDIKCDVVIVGAGFAGVSAADRVPARPGTRWC